MNTKVKIKTMKMSIKSSFLRLPLKEAVPSKLSVKKISKFTTLRI